MQKIDFSVKKAILEEFCLFWNRFASHVTARLMTLSSLIRAVTGDTNLFDRQNAPKMAFFTKQSIFLHRCKVDPLPKIFFSYYAF